MEYVFSALLIIILVIIYLWVITLKELKRQTMLFDINANTSSSISDIDLLILKAKIDKMLYPKNTGDILND